MTSANQEYQIEHDDTQSVALSQLAPEDVQEYRGDRSIASFDTRRLNSETSRPSSPPKTPRSQHGFSNRRANAFGAPGLSIPNNSRPPSAVSRSTTNTPSITAQAFFRPMSSQRLQAQRGARPFTGTSEDIQDVSRTSTSTTNRASVDSNYGVASRPDNPAPPSRGTEFTERDQGDRVYYNSSLHGENTIRTADSSKPLREPSQRSPTTPTSTHRSPQTPKVPRSLRSTFSRPPAQARPKPSERSLASQETTSVQLQEKTSPRPQKFLGRNYEYFSGNTVFCWGGRLQNTRHRPVNIFTGLLIVLPAALFFIFSAPWLWFHVSPAVPVVFAYLLYICASSFLHASVTDPGILPRNLHPLPLPDGDDPIAVGPAMSDWTMVKSTAPNMTAMDVPTKYCKTCNIWRPLRAHHCRLCDSCIETQDHHCVWLNNCVGRRNYRFFFTFVSSAMVLGLLLALSSLGHCIAYSRENSIPFRNSINELRIPFAMFIYGVLVIPYPVSLMGYHLFLTGRAETTREYLNSHKFLPKDRHRPFRQRNIIQNWLAVLLRTRTPAYLSFKGEYIEGDPRFGPRRGKRQAPLSEGQKGGSMEMQKFSTFQAPRTG